MRPRVEFDDSLIYDRCGVSSPHASPTTFAGGTAEEAKAMLTTRKKEGSWKATSICFACRPVTAKIVALANQNAKQLIGTDQRALKDSTAKEYGKELFAAVQKPKDNSRRSGICFQSGEPIRNRLRR